MLHHSHFLPSFTSNAPPCSPPPPPFPRAPPLLVNDNELPNDHDIMQHWIDSGLDVKSIKRYMKGFQIKSKNVNPHELLCLAIDQQKLDVMEFIYKTWRPTNWPVLAQHEECMEALAHCCSSGKPALDFVIQHWHSPNKKVVDVKTTCLIMDRCARSHMLVGQSANCQLFLPQYLLDHGFVLSYPEKRSQAYELTTYHLLNTCLDGINCRMLAFLAIRLGLGNLMREEQRHADVLRAKMQDRLRIVNIAKRATLLKLLVGQYHFPASDIPTETFFKAIQEEDVASATFLVDDLKLQYDMDEIVRCVDAKTTSTSLDIVMVAMRAMRC